MERPHQNLSQQLQLIIHFLHAPKESGAISSIRTQVANIKDFFLFTKLNTVQHFKSLYTLQNFS